MAQKLADVTSPRLESLRQWVGIATLRGLGVNGIPEDYQVEELKSAFGGSRETIHLS
jgi:hypothetical protein